MVGPMMVRPPRESDSSALARCSWSRGTSCGTMLAIAGNEIAETRPCTAASTIIEVSVAVSVMTRNASRPWVAAEKRLDSWSTTVRGNRSATTPPNSRNSTIGIVCAASTWPRAEGESVTSSTAKARAMLAIIPPSVFTNREE